MDKKLLTRSNEFTVALERQILNCDTKQELIMLAFLMMNLAASILGRQLGEESKRKFFSDHST